MKSSSEQELKFYGLVWMCVRLSASPFMSLLKEAAARLSGFVSLSVQLQPAGVKLRKSRQHSARLYLSFRYVIKCASRMLLLSSLKFMDFSVVKCVKSNDIIMKSFNFESNQQDATT
jgi:hypothetical protein